MYEDIIREFFAQPKSADGSRPKRVVSMETEDGARRYYLMTVEELREMMMTSPHKWYLHEFIFPDEPCWFFMDCDGKVDADHQPTASEIRKYVDFVKEKVRIGLEVYNMKASGFPFVFSDCRPGKFSIHIVSRAIAFETPRHCYSFVKSLNLEEYKGITVDKHVYACGDGPVYMRMPFCMKRDVLTNGLVPFGQSACFDEQLFFSGLATYHRAMDPSNRYLTKLPPFVPITLASPRRASEMPRETDVPMDQVALLTAEWLEHLFPSCNPTGIKSDDENGTFRITITRWCSLAKRMHASNGMFVSNNERGGIETCCIDDECRVRVPLGFTYYDILASKTPANVDFSFAPVTKKRRIGGHVE